MPDPALTPILSDLARKNMEMADDLLDLELASRRRVNPGTCVAAYFKLMSRLPESCRPLVKELREWLESHVEVVASDGRNQLERMPARLDGEELEDYCMTVIREFRENRVYDKDLQLKFAFKDAA